MPNPEHRGARVYADNAIKSYSSPVEFSEYYHQQNLSVLKKHSLLLNCVCSLLMRPRRGKALLREVGKWLDS